MARFGGDRWKALLLWAPLLALAAAVSIQKIRTFDYWWHLATGARIVATGAVPKTDPYTFTVAGARWIDIHWLHQLGLYAVYSLGGHGGVVLAKLVIVLAIVAVLASIGGRSDRPAVAVFAIALALLVACDRIMPRPELPTFLCLVGVLALLDRFQRRGDAAVYGIVAIQLVWVNMHGLFALGLALCAIHWVGEILRPVIVPGDAIRWPRVRRLSAVVLLAALASLANPNFVDGALYPIQQLGMIGPPEDRGVFGSLIAELIPPFGGRREMTSMALAIFGSLAGLSFLAMVLNWRRVLPSDPLAWVAFLYLALGAQRNLAIFAFVAAPILVRNLNDVLDAHPIPRGAGIAAGALVSAAITLVSIDVARASFFERIGSMREPGFGVMDMYHPVSAVDWIEEHRPPGPILHHMADGGYLIWRLYPDYPVMVDGRLEVFGPETFIRLQVPDPERFRALDAEYHFGIALIHYSLIDSSTLLWWLYLNSNWRLVHVDDVAALFVRVPDDGPGYPEIDIDAPDLFPPPGEPGMKDQVSRMARTNFYTAMHRYAKALSLWEETIALYPDMQQGRILHAALLHKNGFTAATEAILRQLVEERPDDPILLAQIGDLRLEDGDRDAARQLYDAALEIDPNEPYALYRRAVVAEGEGDLDGAAPLYLRVIARTHPASPLAIQAATRLRAIGGGD